MTTEMAGKQLNSIYDKTDGSNPRMPHFLFYFSIVVVWGFFPLWTLPWQVHCSCLLQGWNLLPFRFAFLCSFPSHLSHPFYFFSLTIPVPLPTSCMYTHTHTRPDTQSPFDISFSSLSSLVFPMRQPSQKCHKNSLCSWYVNTTKVVTVTVFSPR